MSVPVIGLVGGIGAGKSFVARVLADLGCAVIDADRLGHEVLKRDDVKRQMVAAWGEGILDRHAEINRPAVAALVFDQSGDRREYDRLTAITHPELWRRVREEIDRHTRAGAGAGVVIDAALLFEAGLDRLCDAVIYVHADLPTRRERVRRARGWTAEQLARRETFQKSLEIKLESSDYRVDNTRSTEQTADRVRDIHRTILNDFIAGILPRVGRSGNPPDGRSLPGV